MNHPIVPPTVAVKMTIAICFQFFNSPTFSAKSGIFWELDSKFFNRTSIVFNSPLKSENPKRISRVRSPICFCVAAFPAAIKSFSC